jgi:hypothetical protein
VEIERVIKIVEEATQVVIPPEINEVKGRVSKFIEFVGRQRRKLFFVAMLALATLAVLALFQRWLPRNVFIVSGLIAAVLAELAGIAMVFLEIVVELPTLNQLRKAPLSGVFSVLRASTNHDLYYLQRLGECDRKALQYVQKYFQHQRIGLEKRGGLLSGNIDKIGIIPAVIAVFLFWNSLSGSMFGQWVPYLAGCLFAFHILNLFSFGWQQKMDRVIALLEVVNSLKK